MLTEFTIPGSLTKELHAKAIVPLQQNERAVVWAVTFTDGEHLYGIASHPSQTILWRLDADSGVLSNLATVYLPRAAASGIRARDLIEDTINEGAWD
jgi:hypothetical protein